MITKNYIKMCEQAEEIQKAWKPVDWDIFAYRYSKGLGMVWEVIGVKNRHLYIRENCIWLPTQEQLQEMILIDKKYIDMFSLNNDLNDFMIDDLDKKTRSNMNEVWLAFVVKEIYHKEWLTEEEKWIKKEGNQIMITK